VEMSPGGWGGSERVGGATIGAGKNIRGQFYRKGLQRLWVGWIMGGVSKE